MGYDWDINVILMVYEWDIEWDMNGIPMGY